MTAGSTRAGGDNRQHTQVGFVTFDSSYHFYNLKASLSEPQMLCVPDIDDPFLPLPSELLVNFQVTPIPRITPKP